MEKQRRILVVDSDPFERISCRVMLRGVEFAVLFCEDRDSAIERLSKEDFELIMTNISLPNKYIGLTLVQEMKFMRPKSDIVVMADRPSIWDAREAIRIGASGYIERPFTSECLMNIARKTFDRKGWILRKTRIDQFRDYVVPSTVINDPVIYYKNGSWARHLEGCLWEVGYDRKYWHLSGHSSNGNGGYASHLHGDLQRVDCDTKSGLPHDQALSISVSKDIRALTAGMPYAQVLSDTGGTYALAAPLTGIVEEVNEGANEAIVSHVSDDADTDWMLWLARIRTKEWECGTVQDIERGRVIGAYEHMGGSDTSIRENAARAMPILSDKVGGEVAAAKVLNVRTR